MKIAIDGIATLLGQTLTELINEQKLSRQPIVSILHGDFNDLEKSDDEQLNTHEKVANQFLTAMDFTDIDLVFVADNQDHNQDTIARAVGENTTVIDCAGNSRDQAQVPLVVHAINSHEIQGLAPGSVITTPSPGATMLSQILFPLARDVGFLQRVSVCHFAPVAELGKLGVEQLASQSARLLNGMPLSKKQNLEQIAFNLLPQTGVLDEMTYADTETQLMRETRRILNDDTFVMNASCIQVPVFYAQSQVIDLTFANEFAIADVEHLLKQRPGIRLSAAKNASPVAVQADKGNSEIVVSRMRQNPDDKCSLTLWCVSDNLRCGAAGNAVQIADLLIKSYL